MKLLCAGIRFMQKKIIWTIFFIITAMVYLLKENKNIDEDFLIISKCPACYGTDLCPHIKNGNLQLSSWSSTKFFNYLNSKNVFYGVLNGEEVVLKKLAHNWELEEADSKICQSAGRPLNCDVREAIIILLNMNYHLNASTLQNVAHTLKCPSQRFLGHLQGPNGFETQEAAHFLTTAIVNFEGLILKAFPAREWPFPKYFGSCGRVIVEEYVGKTLDYYTNADWMFRLHLADQLMKIAQFLTNNSAEYVFYMTDVSFHNFAVGKDNSVVLIDMEDIIVVDRQDVRKRKPPGWDEPHQHVFDGCSNCLSFSSQDLCDHEISDHNFYAICQSLLAQNAYSPGIAGGLLHGIPWEVNKMWDLQRLVAECAKPSSGVSRFEIVPVLLKTMGLILSRK